MKLKNVFSLLAALVVLCVGAMAVAAPAPSQFGQSRAAIEVAKAEIPANCNLIGYTTKGDESRITFQDPDTLEYYYVKVATATSKIKEIEVKGATFVKVQVVNDCIAAARTLQVQLLVALGGGSAIDTAKAASIVVACGGTVEQYEGENKSSKPGLPIVAVNTTAGTGSECTSFYIVTDPVRHSKMAMVDPNCMVSIAVNDTDFMSSMPPKLTAATGMDALTHAIEAALSKNANPLTDKDAYWAMQAIVQNLPRAVANGQDEAARTMMAYAENVAGMAFSNAGLGMVHAMAHALGGHYNLPHGVCNAVLLPYVLAFNSRSPVCRERFMTIAAAMGLQGTFTPDTAAPAVIQFVRQLSAGVGIPANLAQLNKVDPADFAALAELALHDTCMSTNQITPTRDEVVAVYTAAFRG